MKRLSLFLVLAAPFAAGCGGGSGLTSPSPTVSATGGSPIAAAITIDWKCLVQEWRSDIGIFSAAVDSLCEAALQRLRASTMAGMATSATALVAPDAPTNLTLSISGGTVTVQWSPPVSGDPPLSYVIEAGSSPGTSNLANFDTGSLTPSLIAASVPPGTYYLRVRARNAAGVGIASNEATINVGGGPAPCTGPPGPPTGLTVSVSGSTITLNWVVAAGATSHVVEAGSAPGASNLASFDTGSATPSLSVPNVATGTYYVRVKSRSGCGTSVGSNEVVLLVGRRTDTFAFTLPPGSRLAVRVGPVNAATGPLEVTLNFSGSFVILACVGTQSACIPMGGRPASRSFHIPSDFPAGAIQADVYFNPNLSQPPGAASGTVTFTYNPF